MIPVRKYYKVLHYNYRTKEVTIQLTDRDKFLAEVFKQDQNSQFKILGYGHTYLLSPFDLIFTTKKNKVVKFRDCTVVKEVCSFGYEVPSMFALVLKGKGK